MREVRDSVRRRERLFWATAVGLLVITAAPAFAHDPLDRLRRGDYDGFLDDALRTGWVNASLTAGLSGALALGLRRGLGESVAHERVEDLQEALRECRQRAAEMAQERDKLAKQLDELDRMLSRAGSLTSLYQGLSNVTNVAECAGMLMLFAELCAGAAALAGMSGAAGALGATTGVGGATAYSVALRRLPDLEKALAWAIRGGDRARVVLGEAVTAYKAARGTAQAQLLWQRVLRLRDDYNKAQQSIGSLKELVKSAKSAIDNFNRLSAAGEAAVAGGGVANTVSGNSLLGPVRRFFGGSIEVEEYRKKIAQLRSGLWERKQKLFQLDYEQKQQEKHCAELAAELAKLVSSPGSQGGTPGGTPADTH